MVSKLISLVVVSSLPFLFSLDGEFVFDDSESITNNRDVSSESWITPFYHDFWGTNIKSNLSHKSYRPLTILSFKFNYFLNGRTLSAFQFKVTNLICHVICCILVWQTFKIITASVVQRSGRKSNNVDVAYLAALLFGVHPVHVEAISGIVGRADLLAGLTFFLAFLYYNKAAKLKKLRYLCGAVILAALSMLFKENGVTVLGFCVIFEFATKLKFNSHDKCKLKNRASSKHLTNNKVYLSCDSLKRILFVTVSVVMVLYARWSIMGRERPEFKPIDNPAAFATNVFTKIATHNYIYFLNLLLLIWPQWLCYDWSIGCVPLIEKVTDLRLFSILLLYLYGMFFTYTVIYKSKRRSIRISLLAVSLAVIPFIPASNIFYTVGFVIAERILYISSAGYCLLIAHGLNKLYCLEKYNSVKKISTISFSALILIYGMRSWQRSLEWQTEYQLFVSGLRVCPLNAKVHYNVAKMADAKNQTQWALDEYREAIRLYPEYYQAMNNLANMLKDLKYYDQAECYLRSALMHQEDFHAAWMNLGIVLATVKRYDESLKAYRKALVYRKKYPDCFYNLGNLYLEMNESDNAIENWLQAIQLNPKHVAAWTNLLALLDNSGRLERAVELIPKALNELPESASVIFALANIHGKLNEYDVAEKHFLKAIKLFQNNVQALHYANFGVLYHRWKRYDEAKEMYLKALKIDPTFTSAKKNLQSLENTLQRHRNKSKS